MRNCVCVHTNNRAGPLEFRLVAEKVASLDLPPWRPIASRAMAEILGVSLQVLANWRIRSGGPPHEGLSRGRGNRVFYRPDKVLAWLATAANTPAPAWRFNYDYLAQKGLEVANPGPEITAEMIAAADRLLPRTKL